jgi:hypothetical protein
MESVTDTADFTQASDRNARRAVEAVDRDNEITDGELTAVGN